MSRTFASDNYAGAHPAVLAALSRANEGHVTSYGDDPLSLEVAEQLCDLMGGHEALFCYGGTGANVVGLSLLLRPWESVLCAQGAHINVDECGAVERMLGSKTIVVDSNHGKIMPGAIDAEVSFEDFEHHTRAGVVSFTQSTEMGTVYGVEEFDALKAEARNARLRVHVDGARFANALAATGAGPREMLKGVDVATLGGTKSAMVFGEAVVILDPDLAGGAGKRARKQAGQLPSKSRFVAAQFGALLEDDLWLRLATHANEMAQLLASSIDTAVELVAPVEVNGVFCRLPSGVAATLRKNHKFYDWDSSGVVRLMTAWDTTVEDIEGFVADLHAAIAAS